jgi:N-methylhydantoinase A/oxoprolinase/acetone carboxylase beta subunit
MERRYLVAALAIIATFAVFSRGFHALEQLSFDHSTKNLKTMAAAKCWASSAALNIAKVRAKLHHGYPPEQAQLVAEMNLPGMESTIAEQMSRQDAAISRCAREKALQQAERARRDAMRIQQDYMRAYATSAPDKPAAPLAPMAFAVSSDFQQRFEAKTMARLAQSQVKLQMDAEKLADIEVPTIDVETHVAPVVVPNVQCKVKVSRHAVRDAMHSYQHQYGFTSK